MKAACLLLSLAALVACDRNDKKPPPVASETEPAVPARDERRPTILFLGDSLTAGYGLARSQSMPALVQQKLDADNLHYRVINAGRSGDTTAGGLARLDWYLRPDTKLAAVVISLGSNDAMRGLSLAEAEKNLIAIIEKIKAFDPEVKVFLLQMETFPSMGQEFADEYRAIFPSAAEKTGATLLPFPLEGIAGVPDLNQPDGIHPTAEGTEKMAANIWTALRPHL